MAESDVTPDEAEQAASLVRRIQAGDRDAETDLVQRYSRGLHTLLRHLCRDPDLADDLHQEALRVVLERLRGEGLGEPERLAGFLRATARNLLLNERRKRARRKTDQDSEGLERAVAPEHSPLRQVSRDRQAEAVRRLLAELPTERDRQLLMRFYLAEDDKEVLCRELGLSSLHFNRVLHRAKARFKKILLAERERWDQAVARLLALMAVAAC